MQSLDGDLHVRLVESIERFAVQSVPLFARFGELASRDSETR